MNKLKIAVPVSLSDIHLLEGWVNVFRALGGANHPVEFHPTPPVEAAVIHAARAIRDFAPSVEVLSTGKDFKGGWPSACNAHYGHVIRSLTMRRNAMPWLWCEIDAFPMVPGWADKLINEYILTGGRGAMGVVLPVTKIYDENTPNERVFINEGDLYMVGVAIYDPTYYHVCGGITDQLWRNGDPFDVKLRNYTKKAWRSTQLMSSMSRTINYHFDPGGSIVGEDKPGKKEHEKRAGIVPRGTVFHHGCKDLSLAKLLVEQAGKPWQTFADMLLNVESAVAKAEVKPVEQAPTFLQPLETQQREMPKQDNQLAAIYAQQRAQHPEDEILPVQQQAAAPTEPSGGVNLPTLEDFKTEITKAGKPVRVSNFASIMGTTEQHLQKLAEQPNSGITIVSGWTKMGG